MSKVGGALPSWYWPAGIPRRVPVAQQPLDRLLRQRFANAKDKPALLSASAEVTYGDLLARSLEVAGGLQAAGVSGIVAVGEASPIEGISLFLGALFAGRPALLLDPAMAAQVLASQIAEAGASIVLTSETKLEGVSVPTLSTGELKGNFAEARGGKRASDPAVLLPSGRGVAIHSHFSVSAMAASLAAFIIKLRELPFVCTEGTVCSWETLAAVMLAFMYGMPVVFTMLEDLRAERDLLLARDGYVILRRRDADFMLQERWVPQRIKDASYLFVSTGYFTPKWRRKLEALLGRPIFPMWGLPELGPVVVPHPTWLPVHGHGLPLVNVSLVPVDPASGRVSIVPWELLEQAELGVEALSAMVGYTQAARNAGVRAGTALRTGQIATMDHVGVVVLHEQSGGPAGEALSAN
jgi:AMP-binding enzyme